MFVWYCLIFQRKFAPTRSVQTESGLQFVYEKKKSISIKKFSSLESQLGNIYEDDSWWLHFCWV